MIAHYCRNISQFVEYLKRTSSGGDPEELILSANEKDIEGFLAFLGQRNCSPPSISNKLSSLRVFYGYLVKVAKRIASNPAAAIRLQKPESKILRFLWYDEVKKLLETPPMDNWLGARDRTILETLYNTGMRTSELVALNMDDIDFLGYAVHIRGKGKKERTAPIGSSALRVVQHCIEFRKELAQGNKNFDSEALFVDERGRRISQNCVRKIMREHLGTAGMDMSINPKVLRQSFAVHMLSNGADLRSVQELLGYQSLRTTKLAYGKTMDAIRERAGKRAAGVSC